MTILLISWAWTSLVFCLAFLNIAARPTPRMDTQVTPANETPLTPELGIALEKAKTASLSADAALPSPYQTA